MIKNIVFDIYDVLIDGMEGPIHGAVDLLMEVKSRGFPVYAVSNLSTEGFGQLKNEYPFLRLFDGVVISGGIGLAKPDPAIFLHLLNQFGLNANETLFIDDKAANVEGALQAGLFAARFENPKGLEKTLEHYKILSFDEAEEETSCCGNGCGCH